MSLSYATNIHVTAQVQNEKKNRKSDREIQNVLMYINFTLIGWEN